MTDTDPRIFGDRYQIVRHIARGGMAQVYLARDLMLDRFVALKMLFPELSVDQAFVERFRREARAAANLSHPNIVSIFDWGQGDRTYFIVMEYVDGETLSARIRSGPIDPYQAAAVAGSVAAALDFAHRHQVIHRDVKPGNVLIDHNGQVKVTDFGIAQAVGTSENLTQAGAVMGTATYFSPEQAQGHTVDARSDVYSLGVVLYEMATGGVPFRGDNPVAIAYKHVRELPDAPTSRNPAIPPDYEAIVLRAMAKDPADRYASAEDLRADLERFRAGLPVVAGTDATVLAPTVAAPDATVYARAADPTRLAAAYGGAVPAPPTTTTPVSPGPASPPPRSRTRLYAGLLVVLLAVLAVLVVVVGRDAGLFGTSVRTLTVPRVAGLSPAAARARLSADGFRDIRTATVTSQDVPAGKVAGTSPAAAARIRSDDPLTIETSGGPGAVAVPDVALQPVATAEMTLRAAGFSYTLAHQSSTTVPDGEVIATRPGAGTRQERGLRLEVVVSSGPADVVIPDLTLYTPAVAGADLNKLGLSVTEAFESSSGVPANEVTRTSPPANSLVAYGSPVVVYVSTGPKMVIVPSVIGDTRSQASAALAQVGLLASLTPVPVGDPSQNDRIQSADPAVGASVALGTTVTLDYGDYAASTTTTTAPSSTTTTAPTTTTTG